VFKRELLFYDPQKRTISKVLSAYVFYITPLRRVKIAISLCVVFFILCDCFVLQKCQKLYSENAVARGAAEAAPPNLHSPLHAALWCELFLCESEDRAISKYKYFSPNSGARSWPSGARTSPCGRDEPLCRHPTSNNSIEPESRYTFQFFYLHGGIFMRAWTVFMCVDINLKKYMIVATINFHPKKHSTFILNSCKGAQMSTLSKVDCTFISLFYPFARSTIYCLQCVLASGLARKDLGYSNDFCVSKPIIQFFIFS
jgi:hypothetical protein